MILFIKAWAKRRKINSSYSGTLSSYGYVLMVLHYLVNVANPPVLPNLQAEWTPLGTLNTFDEIVDGWSVRFWRNEVEITEAAKQCQLTNNQEPLGSLLVGFFHYFSSLGGRPTFMWMQEVLSLRSTGGLLTKGEKGWVKAVTEENEGKRIQHRYLFCIEDPFELNHNVARTVTHKGIVAIRDEFRRAKRILLDVGQGLFPKDGELFVEMVEEKPVLETFDGIKVDAGRMAAVKGLGTMMLQKPLLCRIRSPRISALTARINRLAPHTNNHPTRRQLFIAPLPPTVHNNPPNSSTSTPKKLSNSQRSQAGQEEKPASAR